MRRPLPPEISSKLDGIRPSGDEWTARCPAHEDKTASATFRVAEDGKLLVKCHVGCDSRDILAAVEASPVLIHGEEPANGKPRGEWTPRGEAVAVYDYVDEHGVLLFQVCRTADKQFSQRRPDSSAKSGYVWSLGDTRRVLYRLPEVMQAVREGAEIWIAEGEKDVHALEVAGLTATCNPGGAGKWRDEYSEALRDARVTVVADKDTPGQEHARKVAVSIGAHGGTVRIVEAAEGCKDPADHFAAGHTTEQFLTTHEAEQAAKPELALDIHEFLAQDDGEIEWVIPGMIMRLDRVMITAFEGYAKSTFLRQLAVAAASGLDPFTGRRTYPPLRVVMIDCENSDRQTRRAFRKIMPVAVRYGSPVPSGTFFPIIRSEGVDLGREEDAEWLLERVTAHKPDLLIVGPVYRMLTEDPNTDVTIRKIITAIDRARINAQCAVVMEAHAGHGGAIVGRGQTRPLGSSMWMRWVDAGIGFKKFEATDERTKTPLEIEHWKPGRDRDLRTGWPHHIQHGWTDPDTGLLTEWPWMPAEQFDVDGTPLG